MSEAPKLILRSFNDLNTIFLIRSTVFSSCSIGLKRSVLRESRSHENDYRFSWLGLDPHRTDFFEWYIDPTEMLVDRPFWGQGMAQEDNIAARV